MTDELVRRKLDDVTATLDAHAVFLSDADEAELIGRAAETDDVGTLALRTCACGVRIDGFDTYWEHLREALVRDGDGTV